MNQQEEFWSGAGGDSYNDRNRVDWRVRIPFWHDIMKFTGARSVYEVGCGAGWNLSAIREASLHSVCVHGCDINYAAASEAWAAGLPGVWYGKYCGMRADVIFTAGVLIHIAPENLRQTMQELINASTHWVLAIEYDIDLTSSQSIEEQMIEYRGQSNLLWKRPYGKLYEDMGLKLLHTGDATGFNDCAYWLLSKG